MSIFCPSFIEAMNKRHCAVVDCNRERTSAALDAQLIDTVVLHQLTRIIIAHPRSQTVVG